MTAPSEFSLAPTEPGELAVRQPPSDPVAKMLSGIIEKGVTADNVAAFDKLLDVYERLQDKDAERQFAAAFIALQADMPGIRASKPVPGKDGSIRYFFAPFEAIMEEVSPLIRRHGFTLTFSSDFRDDRVIQTCTLQHVGGHKRSNSFAARVGQGPPNSSAAQGDGAASTYAKRFALCDCLNIVIEKDNDGAGDDARSVGAFITRDQAQTLREMVKDTASNEAEFLKWCGATSYEQIGESRYDAAFAALNKKPRR